MGAPAVLADMDDPTDQEARPVKITPRRAAASLLREAIVQSPVLIHDFPNMTDRDLDQIHAAMVKLARPMIDRLSRIAGDIEQDEIADAYGGLEYE